MKDDMAKQVQVNTTRIAVLCQKVDGIKETVDRIENNHLVHIEQKIDDLQKVAAERSPMAGLGTKILETVIQAIVIAVLVVIGFSVT